MRFALKIAFCDSLFVYFFNMRLIIAQLSRCFTVYQISLVSFKTVNIKTSEYLPELLCCDQSATRLRWSSDKWGFAERRYNLNTYNYGTGSFLLLHRNELSVNLKSISE